MNEPKLGKDALLDAAAVLFDEFGIDAVSINRINEASGHRNRSAVSYHFGGKFEVVEALVARSSAMPDAVRGALLDKLEREQTEFSHRDVFEVLVAPMSQALETAEGRRHFRLLGQITSHPLFLGATQNPALATPNLLRCGIHLGRHLQHLTPELRAERIAVVAAFAIRAYADQARLMDTPDPPRHALPLDRFTAHVLDLLDAMLTAGSTFAEDATDP